MRVYGGRKGRSKVLEVVLEVAIVEYKSKALALGLLVDERESVRRRWPCGQCFGKAERRWQKAAINEVGYYKLLYILVLPVETWWLKEW